MRMPPHLVAGWYLHFSYTLCMERVPSDHRQQLASDKLCLYLGINSNSCTQIALRIGHRKRYRRYRYKTLKQGIRVLQDSKKGTDQWQDHLREEGTSCAPWYLAKRSGWLFLLEWHVADIVFESRSNMKQWCACLMSGKICLWPQLILDRFWTLQNKTQWWFYRFFMIFIVFCLCFLMFFSHLFQFSGEPGASGSRSFRGKKPTSQGVGASWCRYHWPAWLCLCTEPYKARCEARTVQLRGGLSADDRCVSLKFVELFRNMC